MLPLVIVATVTFVFLMWETRLARLQSLHAIAGRGTILAMVLLLLSSMLIGWMIGGDADTRRVLAISTSMRNVPDVALTADNVYVTYNNGGSGNFGGTSCAAPLWAGFTALINQQAVAAPR